MKLLILIFLFLCVTTHVFSQTVKSITFVQKCDINPVPIEGMESFKKYIESKFDLSVNAVSRMIKGNVSASFVVSKDGVMKDIVIQDDLGFDTGKELLRLLTNYASKHQWKAGEIDENSVDVHCKIIVEIIPNRASGHFKIDIDLQVLDKPNTKQFKKAVPNTNFKRYVKQIVQSIDAIDKEAAISFDIDENGQMVNVEKISSGHFVDELCQKIMDRSTRVAWRPARIGKEKIKSSYLLNVKFIGLINLSHPLVK